jgi:hypothetical protein
MPGALVVPEAGPIDAELAHARPEGVGIDPEDLSSAEGPLDAAEAARQGGFDLAAYGRIQGVRLNAWHGSALGS